MMFSRENINERVKQYHDLVHMFNNFRINLTLGMSFCNTILLSRREHVDKLRIGQQKSETFRDIYLVDNHTCMLLLSFLKCFLLS